MSSIHGYPAVTDAEIRQFQEDGFVVVRNLFDREEIELLLNTAKSDVTLEAGALARRDGEGGITRLRVWNQEDDSIYGRFARCHRVVDRMEAFLGGEVYFYHSKMMLKEPRTGGAWAWHQDYGYWYNNGCLFPYMGSCMIAVDRATRDNGCLQVLKGSHHLGRVDHLKVGDQTGADPARVEQAAKVFPLVYCEMEPGSAIFFHCNLLHRSDQNRSETSRWTFICCFNAARNNPYKEHHHPLYHKLHKVPDSAIRDAGLIHL
ncbi:MAG: phytanoyl-CoA dioxygenase family protein [Planctomycetota bacterium]